MFPNARETLDRLKELGIKLALITNGAAEPQRAKVVRFALKPRFDHIQIAARDAVPTTSRSSRAPWR